MLLSCVFLTEPIDLSKYLSLNIKKRQVELPQILKVGLSAGWWHHISIISYFHWKFISSPVREASLSHVFYVTAVQTISILSNRSYSFTLSWLYTEYTFFLKCPFPFSVWLHNFYFLSISSIVISSVNTSDYSRHTV